MHTDHRQRVTLILLVIVAALWCIFPRAPKVLLKPFRPNVEYSFAPDLKPGIDMVGGTKLVYDIKTTDGQIDMDLSNKVAAALKKRVDPDGVKNLIWRPQGASRLEIQMPLTPASKEVTKLRERYAEARKSLAATEIAVQATADVLPTATGEARAALIKRVAGDSATRLDILNRMSKVADEQAAAKAAKDVVKVGELNVAYEQLVNDLSKTNVRVNSVEAVLKLSGKERDDRLAAFRDQIKDFPSAKKALEDFLVVGTEYAAKGDLVDDAADLKRKLQGSGVLTFHILADDISTEAYTQYLTRLKEDGPNAQLADNIRWMQVKDPQEFHGRSVQFGDQSYVLVYTDAERSMMQREGQPNWGLKEARKQSNDSGLTVGFAFDLSGTGLFRDLTARWCPNGTKADPSRGEREPYLLGIALDGKLISAPAIRSMINGGGEISGNFSPQDQDYLVSTLNAGSLPAQLTDEPVSETTVGPQLGADNLRAGLLSCVAGLIIVTVFLLTYYYFSGLVAVIAVFINLILVLGCMAALNATFTLPGVAGMVLSVAMAVDANVLIFERLREEQARGLSLKMALRNSYDRAMSAILDANVTTAISSLALYVFGSEEVRGFGLTLLLGIMTSLFTALFVTRTIFGILTDKFGLSDLGSLPRTFPGWNRALTPKIDWVGKMWLFAGFSFIFLTCGLTMWGIKLAHGEALDIEFSGGTTARLTLKKELDREQVQNLVDDISLKDTNKLAAPRVVAVGNDKKNYEVSTPTTNTKDVQAQLINGLRDSLDVPAPSRFDAVDSSLDAAQQAGKVIPIESRQTTVPGSASSILAEHVGGVAILLTNIQPPLPADVVRERLEQRMMQEDASKRIGKLDVEQLPGNSGVVVFMSDNRSRYSSADASAAAAWADNLAGPAWRYVREAVNNPPQLKGVTSFNAQVAGEAMYNTIVALILSVLGIMAYIWIRFGDFKFGTATVVACVHDALFVLAAIGFSLYVGQWSFFENVLQIHPFRLDLTLVASILTVVGYSMNDTVVVFDRIRENRGKLGVLSRAVVNDSINQTMSRTILTGGTSIGILAVMYFLGGEGIHGFTFAMLLGILVGTYSSIAIAAPLLLYGGKTTVAPVAKPATA